jgi:hypothetical protein
MRAVIENRELRTKGRGPHAAISFFQPYNVDMQAQKAELLNQLPEHGWRVKASEENLEWWADEMLVLESEWSPVGSQAYVTFLVDPQFDGDRRKGEAVCAVMASPDKPMSRLEVADKFTLYLGQGWKKTLPDFFAHLSSLRG